MTDTFDGSSEGQPGTTDDLPPTHPFYGLNNWQDGNSAQHQAPAANAAPAGGGVATAAPPAPPQALVGPGAASSAGDGPQARGWSTDDANPASGHAGAHNGGSEMSGLALLRERMQERDSQPVEPFYAVVPGIGLRFVCHPVIEHADFKRWMKAATSTGKKKRSGQQADANDIDQLVLSAYALTHQCERVEMNTEHGTGRAANWVALPAPEGGPLTLGHQAFWREYNVLSSLALLQKLYRVDPKIIQAGQDLLTAAGYGDDEDDDNPEG